MFEIRHNDFIGVDVYIYKTVAIIINDGPMLWSPNWFTVFWHVATILAILNLYGTTHRLAYRSQWCTSIICPRPHCTVEVNMPSLNLMHPGRCSVNVGRVNSKLLSGIAILSIPCAFAFSWMSYDFNDDKSTLIQPFPESILAWMRGITWINVD